MSVVPDPCEVDPSFPSFTECLRVPILLVRTDGVIYDSGHVYTYKPYLPGAGCTSNPGLGLDMQAPGNAANFLNGLPPMPGLSSAAQLANPALAPYGPWVEYWAVFTFAQLNSWPGPSNTQEPIANWHDIMAPSANLELLLSSCEHPSSHSHCWSTLSRARSQSVGIWLEKHVYFGEKKAFF